jgi:putative transposase
VAKEKQQTAREVMPDHVHIVVQVHPTDSPAGVTRRFKGRTGRVLRAGFLWLTGRRVLWSKSYFAASVGYASEQTVRRCIEHQWDAA